MCLIVLYRPPFSKNQQLAAAAAENTVLAWRGVPVMRLLYAKGELETRPLYERWNSYSRVRITGDEHTPGPPFAWGLSAKWPPERLVSQFMKE